MAWRGDQLSRISGSEELQIATKRPDGTQRRWTPIWVVRVDDGLYIRSAAGRTSAWYRHATQHSRARIKASGIEADVTLQPVADAAINTRVSAAYRAKYENQGSWLAMFLRPPATETTLRIEV
jgi:hypothetical protein